MARRESVVLLLWCATTALCCPSGTVVATSPSPYYPENTTELFQLSSLFSPEESRRIIDAAEEEEFATNPDSTDQAPSFELYVSIEGRTVFPKVEATFASRVDECVTPMVREKWGRDDLVPCTSFVRRYAVGQRTSVPPHRDLQAAVTVVVELRAADVGGLYTLETAASEPRPTRMRAGDAVVHDYQLLHGVDVGGADARYSLVLWFQRGAAACSAGKRWPSPAREALIDATLPRFVEAASALLGGPVDAGEARVAMEAHADRMGNLDDAALRAAIGRLRAAGDAGAREARDAALDAGLDVFLRAAASALEVDRGGVDRGAARRAMARHADESGKLDRRTFFAALASLRAEL